MGRPTETDADQQQACEGTVDTQPSDGRAPAIDRCPDDPDQATHLDHGDSDDAPVTPLSELSPEEVQALREHL